MATATIDGSTVVFSNSGAAANLTTSLTADGGLTYNFDVLSASGGGTKTTIYSVDNGTVNTTFTGTLSNNFINYDTDLLNKDTQVSTWQLGGDTSAFGAHVWIGTDNKIHYDASTVPALVAQINALAAGDHLIDSFEYTIKMSNGTLSVGTLTVDITGVNDAPAITSNGGGATASVNVNENTTTVTTVTATDVDLPAQTLTYSILETPGTDFAKFTIDHNTGALTFVAAPNFENPQDVGGTPGDNAYVVDVQVDDGDGGTDVQTITVNVKDVNEAPTDIAPNSSSINENTAAGTEVATLTSTDPDSSGSGFASPFTYAIVGGTGSGLFAIDGDKIKVNGALDYETATSYTLDVQTTDNGGQTYHELLTININNLDEVAPTFDSGTTAASIDENSGAGQLAYDTDATDPALDGGPSNPVSYALGTAGGDEGAFSINSSNGEVTLTGNPDYETKSSYSFEVVATDAAGNSNSQTVTLNINDVIENSAPVAHDDVWALSDTAIPVGTITPIWFTNNDTDPDGDTPLYITSINGSSVANGDVVLGSTGLTAHFSGGHLTGIDGTAVTGSYSLTYTLDDGHGGTDTGAVTLQVSDTQSNPPGDSITLDGNDFSFIDAQSQSDSITGDMILIGNAGIDTFVGGTGNDALSGGAGNDSLFGGSGDDVLTGGAGIDSLTGDSGNDRFTYTAISDSTPAGADTVHDFTLSGGNSDIIDLSAIDADSATGGKQDLTFGGTTATAHGVWYQNSSGTTTVFVDTDGNTATHEMQINLTGTLALTTGNFDLQPGP